MAEAVLGMQEFGTQENLWIFYYKCAIFRCECHPYLNKVYIACISISKYLKSFFLFVSKCLQTLLLSLYVYAGLGQYAAVPTALGCGSDWHGTGAARPLAKLQDWEQQRSVWQWQHSIQLCNTPTFLMHFTLSRLNCFGLLISFSSSKQNSPPPPLFLDKEFCHMLQINCNLSDALLPPTSWAAFKKTKKKQLKRFCFGSNQTKIETFCSLIQGLMCLITPFLLCIT